MKEKILITILIIVLGVLIFRMGMKQLNTGNAVEHTKEENMEVIKILSDLENGIAYEEYMESIAETNELFPCELEKMFVEGSMNEESLYTETGVDGTNDRIGIDATDQLSEYSKLYPDLYVDKICPKCADTTEKIAFLTFDDGPSKNTTKILDILEEKNAVATFFVLGSTMDEEGENALKRMPEIGCKIGIHTYSHKKNVIYASVQGFLDDFYQVYTQIYELTGEKVNIFRFPWGSYNSYSKPIKKNLVAEMERRGFTYYDWNVSAEDSVGHPTESSIMKNILKDVKKYNKPVILMHDASVNKLTVRMLPQIIDQLVELGYSFGTLDQREPCQFCY